MPQVNIDDDAYRIIVKERDEMKKRGIRASLSDAMRSITSRMHVAETLVEAFRERPVEPEPEEEDHDIH